MNFNTSMFRIVKVRLNETLKRPT